MSHSVRRHLRLEIDAYDETIRRFIPAYETMLAVAADAVAAVGPDLVVDLGSGTGALSEVLLGRPRVGVVELLDVDSEMMDQARRRLRRFGERVRFTLRSYDEPFQPCDAFAASLSLHHVATLEAKSALYSRVFDALRPGGVFVNADANMPTDRTERDRLFRYWADHLVASGISEDRAWRHFDEWAEEDTYLPLDAELEALAQLGFEADRVWSDGPIGVVVAKRPEA
ncbi:MAG: class I SAM-dependent methyltransferase [Gemmatimonadetes bacterium]|nr:class I SAM-dependent methyltransferase [Gemmatimonadota bacterium]